MSELSDLYWWYMHAGLRQWNLPSGPALQRVLQHLSDGLRLRAVYTSVRGRNMPGDLRRRFMRSKLRELQHLPGGLRVYSMHGELPGRRLRSGVRRRYVQSRVRELH